MSSGSVVSRLPNSGCGQGAFAYDSYGIRARFEFSGFAIGVKHIDSD